MFERIIGVLRLDVNTFEAIEADENATVQAAIIVGLVGLLAAIGAFFAARTANATMDALSQMSEADLPLGDLLAAADINPFGAFLSALIGAFVAWLVLSAVTYFVGTSLFGGKATMGEMMRVIGFAQAPRLLSVLAFIPCLGAILSFVGWVWMLIATFIGIRQGLDLDNIKTLVTVLVSIVVVWVINWLIGLIFVGIF
jgi:hypothetical protein